MAQIFLLVRPQGLYGAAWAAWGALTAGPILGYALLTRLVSPTASGSAIALLNFFAVACGALFQGGIGLVVDLMGETALVDAQWLALLGLVVLQGAALSWMLLAGRTLIGKGVAGKVAADQRP